ncbi:chemotaxis protein [Paraburkholderia sp. DHOC27]|uniref:chemotaxis protein n=1 Tax=Paraburkholderia sp. DHOC27 TaxID=2303330 RepID=UPI0015F32CFC|nr:chemotaxis protein [Paraburkholderia sp. DHOC27]
MSSTLNPDDEPQSETQQIHETGSTTGALGPSDSSDSGSDVAGAKRHAFDVDSELDNHALETGDTELGSDTDRYGTGERAAADGDGTLAPNADIEPDRVDDLLVPDEPDGTTDADEMDETLDPGEA